MNSVVEVDIRSIDDTQETVQETEQVAQETEQEVQETVQETEQVTQETEQEAQETVQETEQVTQETEQETEHEVQETVQETEQATEHEVQETTQDTKPEEVVPKVKPDYLPEKLKKDVLKLVASSADVALAIYETDFDVEHKDDESPVTMADRKISKRIVQKLKTLTPGVPVLSEESDDLKDYKDREKYEYLWILDPIDGTSGFVKKNGKFCISLGLVRNREPVCGFIAIPTEYTLYYTVNGANVFKRSYDDVFDKFCEVELTKPQRVDDEKMVIIASGSKESETDTYIKENYPNNPVIYDSSAIKFCKLVEGKAHIYPRKQGSYEWDTCAGHALVRAAGGSVYDFNGYELRYNKENLLNPFFEANISKEYVPLI